MNTKQLERKLYDAVACQRGFPGEPKNGWHMCFEVAVPPHEDIIPIFNRERVDALCLETHGWDYSGGVWRCFELKITKSDFYSSAKLSFYGHYNYFVLPTKLYEQVKEDIPNGIGVYCASEDSIAFCVKRPKRQEIKIPHEKLIFAMMQRLSREFQKSMK